MKNLLFILLLCFGCASNHSQNIPCNENLVFKESFLKNIKIVEDITYGKSSGGNLRESLKFISNYAPVSYRKLENYQFGYNNLESFESDKAVWLKWYEENKCNNIQFR